MPADFKATRILAPLSRALRSKGVLLGVQARGGDPGVELIRRVWPDEDPFPVDRHDLLSALRDVLGPDVRDYDLMALPDSESTIRYSMHTLPTEIGSSIGTSTLFAAWNAAIYVGQIDDEQVEACTAAGKYLEATADVLHEFGGLWFEDETFIIRRH